MSLRRGLTALAVGLVVGLVVWTSRTQPGTVVVTQWGHFAQTAHVPHGCWTGTAPKGVKVPGHVWATIPGGRTGIFGRHWTGKALDQLFAGKPTLGLTVMGFCR
jgi:hypothetical protein